MTDFSDEQAAKMAAIEKARNSDRPRVSAEEADKLLQADLDKAQAAIDALHEKRHAG